MSVQLNNPDSDGNLRFRNRRDYNITTKASLSMQQLAYASSQLQSCSVMRS